MSSISCRTCRLLILICHCWFEPSCAIHSVKTSVCYWEMFCTSTDYAVARCPSVTCRYCVKITKCIIIFFSPLGTVANTILVFSVPNIMEIFRRVSPNGDVECRGMKNCDFRPISRFILEMIQDRDASKNSCVIYRMMLFPVTLDDLEWLTKIFNDTKHQMAFLRQLSFLLSSLIATEIASVLVCHLNLLH